MAAPASLYDQPPVPVFAGAADWLFGTLLGSLAIALCIVAVALFGLAMLSGRISIRRGGMLVLGCFLLLGSGQIAKGLLLAAHGAQPVAKPVVPMAEAPQPAPPPADYDPYAGASLRRD